MSLEFKTAPATRGNFIVDDIGAIVAKVRERWITADNTTIKASNTRITADGGSAPYYMYGHKLEIAREILKRTQTYMKYPLFILVMDFPEVKQNGILTCTLNIGIVAHTNKDYTAQARYTNVFKTTLYPLYERFFEALHTSGLFIWEGKGDLLMPEHTKIDRPFWGTGGEGNQTGQKKNAKSNFTDDPLDCIEIVGLKLSQQIK